jgi:thiamine biosynthesis lipoprotein
VARELIVPAGLRQWVYDTMGTELVVLAPEGSDAAGPIVRDLFGEWDQRFSRFRADSELGAVNAAAGTTVPVSAAFVAVIRVALDAAAATDGLFDPTLRSQLVDLGYDVTFADLAQDRPAATSVARPGGGWRGVELDAAEHTVRLPVGVGLDLGGIAKGLAVDAAIELLDSRGIRPAAVSAGGDIAVLGTPPGLDAWSIELSEIAGVPDVGLAAGAIASSTIARRRWLVGGQERHHIVDPRTGISAESGLRSVSVVARDCARAEVAAKVALILGPVDGRRFLEAHDLAGVLQGGDGRVEISGTWGASPSTPVAARPAPTVAATVPAPTVTLGSHIGVHR